MRDVEVVDDGSDSQGAQSSKHSRARKEYAHGHTLVSHIDGRLDHGDCRRHPAFGQKVCEEEEGHTEAKAKGEHVAERASDDAKQAHNHAYEGLSPRKPRLKLVTDKTSENLGGEPSQHDSDAIKNTVQVVLFIVREEIEREVCN